MGNLSKERFPTAGDDSGVVYMLFGASGGRGPTSGTACIGLTSGATGICAGYYENPDRIAISSIINGPGGPLGTPFLPNEVIEQVGDVGRTVTILPQPKTTKNASATAGIPPTIEI